MTTTFKPTLTGTRAGARPGPIVLAGAVSGLAAAAATTAVALGAKAIDIPMMAAPQTATAAEAIPLYGFAQGTITATVIGTLLALALARWARRPAATFVAITVVLTVVSFAGPITTGFATTATRVVLALTHVVAAAIVIPAIARRLPQTR
jgi:hypothetical protein